MKTIVTEYSVYELDEENKQIRRMASLHEATPRQGEDGVWRDYYELRELDYGLLIIWDEDGRATLTSPVVV